MALLPARKLAVEFEQHKEELVKTLQVAHDMAASYLRKQADKMEKYFNQKAMESSFEIGDRVLVSELKKDIGRSPKL